MKPFGIERVHFHGVLFFLTDWQMQKVMCKDEWITTIFYETNETSSRWSSNQSRFMWKIFEICGNECLKTKFRLNFSSFEFSLLRTLISWSFIDRPKTRKIRSNESGSFSYSISSDRVAIEQNDGNICSTNIRAFFGKIKALSSAKRESAPKERKYNGSFSFSIVWSLL